MEPVQIVIDTNVLLCALRSSRGPSFRLLSLVGECDRFEINVSVPLVLEYEDVAKRHAREIGLRYQDIDDIVDYLCRAGNQREIFFLWRPYLKDTKDDMVLELAVEANCQYIVTYNQRDFEGSERFGVQAIEPKLFLQEMGVKK